MRWYHYLALFFAGAFLVNSIPHFTNGISGRPFPSPVGQLQSHRRRHPVPRGTLRFKATRATRDGWGWRNPDGGHACQRVRSGIRRRAVTEGGPEGPPLRH